MGDAEMCEMNLAQLEKAVEQLSRLLLAVQEAFDEVENKEREENKFGNCQDDLIEKLFDVNRKMRKDIEDKTRLCDNRRLALIDIVKEGPSYKDLVYEEDN